MVNYCSLPVLIGQVTEIWQKDSSGSFSTVLGFWGKQAKSKGKEGTQTPRHFGFPTRHFGSPTNNFGFPTRHFGFPTKNFGFPTRHFGFPTRRGWGNDKQIFPSNIQKVSVYSNSKQWSIDFQNRADKSKQDQCAWLANNLNLLMKNMIRMKVVE